MERARRNGPGLNKVIRAVRDKMERKTRVPRRAKSQSKGGGDEGKTLDANKTKLRRMAVML